MVATVGVVVVERGRRREAEARALAETNFDLAQQAVDDYLTSVSENTLLKEQDSVDIRRLRSELLKTALGYYASSSTSAATIPSSAGSWPRPTSASARSRARSARPARRSPPSTPPSRSGKSCRGRRPTIPSVRVHLARSYLGLGEQLARIPDFPRAFAALARSREILKGLEAEKPAEVSYRVSLAECDKELGIAEGEGGEPDRGLERLREAEAILKAAARGLARRSGRIASGWPTRSTPGASSISRTASTPRPSAAFREFQGICQIPAGRPSHGTQARPAPQLAGARLLQRGLHDHQAGEQHPEKESLPMFEKSLEYRTTLAKPIPRLPTTARTWRTASRRSPLPAQGGAGRRSPRRDPEPIELLEDLVASQPDQPRYHAELGRSYHILGYLLRRGPGQRAGPGGPAASPRGGGAGGARRPGVGSLQDLPVPTSSGIWASNMWTWDRVAEGLPHYRRSVELRRQLLAAGPNDRHRNLELAEQLALLATVERHGGDPASARRDYAEAAALLEPLDSAAVDAEVQVPRATYLIGEAMAAADQGRTPRPSPCSAGPSRC